jgi:predicted PurR-regulated permease PerM
VSDPGPSEFPRAFYESAGARRRRWVFLSISGALSLVTLIAFREILAPFILAIVLAYVLTPVVARLEASKSGKRYMPRWVAVLVVYVTLIASIVVSSIVIIPRLLAEGGRLASEAPQIADDLRTTWMPRITTWMANVEQYTSALDGDSSAAPEAPAQAGDEVIHVVPGRNGGFDIHLPPRGIEVARDGDGWRLRPTRSTGRPHGGSVNIGEVISRAFQGGEASAATALDKIQGVARAVVRGIVGGIFTLSMTLMLSAYLLITSDRIFDFFRSFVRYDRRGQFNDLIRRIDRGLGGVVRGQLLICLVNGVLSGIGFYIAGLPYWPLLTVIATVLSLVPIFGSIISSVPAIAIALIYHGFGMAMFVLVWIIAIHQLEANFLNPKIMGDSAKVHPVLVVFALLAGEHFGGAFGALLAVPVLSVAQSLFLHFRMVALGTPASSTAIPPPMDSQ